MSFDIKYDRDGNPIKSSQQQEFVEQAAAPVIEEVIEQVEEVIEEVTEEQVQEQPKKPEYDPQASFRALREKAERAERERDELARRYRELESQKQAPQQQPEEDYNVNLGDDDIAEGKHLSKVSRKIQKLEAELNQYKQQTNLSQTETRLKSQYPDFDKIVSTDNVEKLKLQFPEIASTLMSSQDPYAMAVSAYTMIKRLGISQQEDAYVAEKAIAQKNAAKPRPLASVSPQQGDSPLSRANAFANGLTDELKEQLRKEMVAARQY